MLESILDSRIDYRYKIKFQIKFKIRVADNIWLVVLANRVRVPYG